MKPRAVLVFRMTQSGAMSNGVFVCLLTGGILIVVGGFSGALMMGILGTITPMGGMMGGFGSMMPLSWSTGLAWWMGGVGIVTGSAVIFAAYSFRKAGSDRTAVGTIAIVAGALSLLAMGGWFLGAVLAIVGGALALGGGPAARAHPPTQ